MLSAGRSTNLEAQLGKSPEELRRATQDLGAMLEQRGVEGVESEAAAFAQQEIADVHHVAALRPEDVEVAPDEAREMEASARQAEQGVEAARQALHDTIHEAVQSEAREQQVQAEARQERQAESGEENGQETPEAQAALAAETETDASAESAAIAAKATEARATANVQLEQGTATVSEMILAGDTSAKEESPDATPMAEDPAARQQQVTEQGDRAELTDTHQENPDSSASPDHISLWKNGYSAEAMAYLQKTGEAAFGKENTRRAREAGMSVLLALDQARRQARGRRLQGALDDAIGILESIPYQKIEQIESDISAEEQNIAQDEELSRVGEIDPASLPHLRQARFMNIQGLRDVLEKINQARTEVLASYQEALQEVQEASMDTDFDDTPLPYESAAESEVVPPLDNGFTPEVTAYLGQKAETAFLSEDMAESKTAAMAALRALDQLRSQATETVQALIDNVAGTIEGIPFHLIEGLSAEIQKEQRVLGEEETAVQSGELDMASYQHVHQARLNHLQGLQMRQMEFQKARREVLQEFQQALEAAQQASKPAEAESVPVSPALSVPAEAAPQAALAATEASAPALGQASPEAASPSPVKEAPVASASDISTLQLEAGPVVQPNSATGTQEAPPATTPDQQPPQQQAADQAGASKTEAGPSTPPPAATSERAPGSDPGVDKGFTPDMMGFLRSQAQEAFLHDDPKVRKAGFRKLVVSLHPDKFEGLDDQSKARGEQLSKIVSDLGGDNISRLNTQIATAEAAIAEAQASYDRGDIDDQTFGLIKRGKERLIRDARQDIIYDKGRREALFERFSSLLDEIEGGKGAEPDQAAEEVNTDGADASQDADVPPTDADQQADAQDQADQQPKGADQSAQPDQPGQAASPDRPPAAPDSKGKRRNFAERMAERRRERVVAARKAYAESQKAVQDQEKLLVDFKAERGSDLHPVEQQYLKLMEMRLEALKVEEEMARLALRRLEAEGEIADLTEKQANAKTDEEKADLQEQIDDLKMEVMDIDESMAQLKGNLERLNKKTEILEAEYRTAVQQMPETLEGESLLTEEKRQPQKEAEREVKEEGVTAEKPKDQAPGFGDKLAELWQLAGKTVKDLIE